MLATDRFRINAPKVVNETIDGEVVILNLERGRYYSLVESGSRVWGAIERMASVEDIVEDLVDRYDAQRSDVEAAVHRLLEELHREEIIVDAPPEGSHGVQSGSLDTAPGKPAEPRPAARAPFLAPVLQVYTDMQDLLLLDPIHEVDETGWPHQK